MIVLKSFLRMLKRNILMVLSYLLIFLIISVISMPKKAELPKEGSEIAEPVYFCLQDHDKSPASEALASYLEKSFIRRELPEGEAEAEDAILIGTVSAVITIHEHFTENIRDGREALVYELDPREPWGQWLKQKIEVFLRLAYTLTDENGVLDLDTLNKVLDQQADFAYPEHKQAEGGKAYWFEKYYLFLSYILPMLIMQLFAQILIPFKEGKVRNRSLISGYSNIRYQGELILGQLLTAAVILLLFVLGSLALGRPSSLLEVPRLPLYIANAGVFTLVSLALSYLMITLLPNRSAVIAAATVLPLGLSFISGVIVPQEFLSSLPLTLSKAFPFYYYVRVTEGKPEAGFDLGIQLFFAGVYILLALVISRTKKKESVNF